ncbi:hypothetical protein GGQ85_002100 [Nitrobacter vulgaris]|jgi:hypothetical protein|uniref:copper uptake system-associated protein n=1 Tax=Nitrobacter vulgaris TaxID=29421 RepID=UPI00285FD1A5|nr:copper uptake system-associated protein [Nitrobacter vulgaris]MDR6304393.1 hypothetical protein [Nitrobacter vulgaris]
MLRTLVALIVALFGLTGAAGAGADEDAVRHLLHTAFDKPEQKLVIEPLVVGAGYAIAGWTQGDMGGRALLQNKHGRWTLILCAGDGIKTADALRQAGVASDAADALAQALTKAEQSVAAERLAMFARFEGLLRIDEAGDHPPIPHHKH